MGLLRNIVICAAAALVAADGAPYGAVSSVKFSGNGCPNPGDLSYVGDLNEIDFKLRKFKSSTTDATTKVQNCEVQIQAGNVGAGWQVAVSDIYIKGHLWLDGGETFQAFTQTFFQTAAAGGTSIATKYNTTINSAVTIHQSASKLVWSSCSGSDGNIDLLVVDFIGALSGSGSGVFTASEEDIDLEWRKC